ncbi:MAG: hypothetical protein AVDCRST_MAG04-2915, partial [uncultured Acetobacteraceae bacterium]
ARGGRHGLRGLRHRRRRLRGGAAPVPPRRCADGPGGGALRGLGLGGVRAGGTGGQLGPARPAAAAFGGM